MRKSILILLTVALCVGSSVNGYGQNKNYFSSNPSLSPDGNVVYFCYQGDIWKVSSKGGEALRVTALEGEETNPRVSPDGKWLAFSSNQYGNYDIFIMPIEGGEIKQLTFHQAKDEIESWSWNSETIYFTSNRYNNFGSYIISKDGGTEKKLFNNYFNNTHGLVETPAGEYIFTNTYESQNQVSRKRYKGENNPDLLAYNPKTKTFKQYTDYIGKDFNPSVDKNGNIYFISDENNGEYNLYVIENGTKKALTNFETSIKKPFVSANGEKVIFEKDYQLYIYDVNAKKTELLVFTINQNQNLVKEQDFKTKDNISYFDISADGKKIVFVSRGIIFVSDVKGKFIKQVYQSPERVLEVKWLKDNKSIIFNQTYKGYQNFYTLNFDGKSQAKQITSEERSNRDIALNQGLTQAVYLSGRDQLRLFDLKSFKSTTIAEEEIWGFQNSTPSFSPNGEYVLFNAIRNFERDIFTHHIKNKQTLNLTNTGVNEADPVWSADGKYIYFASNRTQPSYPMGMRDATIYRMALDWFDTPYKSEKFDSLFVENKTDKKKKGKQTFKAIDINTDRILERIESISPRFGAQYNPNVFIHKDKEYVFYNSNQDNGKSKWHRSILTDFEEKKTELAYEKKVNQFIKVENECYILSEGNIYNYNIDTNKAEAISIDYTFNQNISSEFTQMFYETWAGVEENFYESNFHGIDWKKKKEQYETYLPFVTNRNDLRILLNDLLGELNSSHLGFNTTGKEEKTYLSYFTNETGIVFKAENAYEIERIVRKSNAFKKEIQLQEGDLLTAVNGKTIQPNTNRDYYFTTPSKLDEIELEFKRKGKEFKTKIHPMSYDELKQNLYDEWILNNHKRVDKLSNNRIAYSYMKNMGSEQLESFLLDMVEQENNKEATILDLRFNTGGNVHDQVLNFLAQRPYLKWQYRGGKLTTQGNFSPSGKPIVLLVNEVSLSDAEMTAAGFKELKLGTIIGTETYRWIIFTSGKQLVDGSFYRIPAWGTYTLDGKNLEFTGVTPDIYVKNTFMDRLEDKDPQLDRAVQEILKQLK